MPGDRFRMVWGEYVTLTTEWSNTGTATAITDGGETIKIRYSQVDESWKED